jgi:hypothetical protein
MQISGQREALVSRQEAGIRPTGMSVAIDRADVEGRLQRPTGLSP